MEAERPQQSSQQQREMKDRFADATRAINRFVSSPKATVGAFGLIVAWALTGPLLHFSDTWQLIINTTTTIVTFLMVFLLQNAQTRDTTAINAKLDEIARALGGADDRVVGMEDRPDSDVERQRNEIKARATTNV